MDCVPLDFRIFQDDYINLGPSYVNVNVTELSHSLRGTRSLRSRSRRSSRPVDQGGFLWDGTWRFYNSRTRALTFK